MRGGREDPSSRLCDIWEVVACALEEVVAEEESPERMLHPSAHLHQVSQDVLAGALVGLDVHHPHSH